VSRFWGSTTTGLSASTRYYFALKVGDEKPNWSGLSNAASDSTVAGDVWSPLAGGMNLLVQTLTVCNGQLIAGGYFTSAGYVIASRVAAWSD